MNERTQEMQTRTSILTQVKADTVTNRTVVLYRGKEHIVLAVTVIGSTHFFTTADDVLHFDSHQMVTIVL